VKLIARPLHHQAAILGSQLTSLTICQHFELDTWAIATFASAQKTGTATAARIAAGMHASKAA
jgi:hypothetical protein